MLLIVLLLILSLVFFLLRLIAYLPCLRNWTMKMLKKIYDSLFWNGVIRAIYLAYYQVIAKIVIHCQWWLNDRLQENSKQIQVLATVMVLLILAIAMFFFLFIHKPYLIDKKYRDSEDHQKFMQKYSNSVNFINFDRHPSNVYFYAVFFFRRLVIFGLSVVWFNWSSLQIQMIIFFQLLYIIYYGLQEPH